MDMAATRTAPNSTYKIYDALFALEEGIITPKQSLLAWNQEDYPFDAWEQDQTLQTAMSGSVQLVILKLLITKWAGKPFNPIFRKIGYGNETIGNDISSYWLESTLKISPVEQVELLKDFYHNTFGFDPEICRP